VSGSAPGANTRQTMTARRAAAAVSLAALAAAALLFAPDLGPVLERLADTLGPWTYALVAGMAFLETGAFVGLLAPGETAVVLGGVVAARGGVSLPAILLVAWAGSALGDLASFALGRRLGRPFLHHHGPRFKLTEERVEHVERFYARHGGKAILIGRFIGLVRAVSPFLAGSSGLRTRAFLPYSLLGTAVWSSAYTLIGYAGGTSELFTKGALAVALAVAAGLLIAHRAGRPRTPASRPAR
jgi:membrane-associated protein